MPSPDATRRSKLDFAARALQPTHERRGFFPGSGSSTRAVITGQVYRVTANKAPAEVPGTDPEDIPRLLPGGTGVAPGDNSQEPESPRGFCPRGAGLIRSRFLRSGPLRADIGGQGDGGREPPMPEVCSPGDNSYASAASSDAGATGAPSERMSIRQPVSRAASRAFCPSLPMASES
jgi:hypothetical protein